jgi:hypothetical protein
VASPANKFVTVKWAWYEKDKQFFQAFIAAAPGNEIIKKSLSIMLELLNGTRAKRGGGEMHMIGTQAMQDAWAELAQYDDSVASHGKNEELYLLSEHRIGEYQGSSSYVKLPTQTNGGDAGYTDITCNFVVAMMKKNLSTSSVTFSEPSSVASSCENNEEFRDDHISLSTS